MDEKGDIESISRGPRLTKLSRKYARLFTIGWPEKEQIFMSQQQIFMSNMIMTTRQQALVSLMRLQALGVTDMEINNMAHLMDFGTIFSLK